MPDIFVAKENQKPEEKKASEAIHSRHSMFPLSSFAKDPDCVYFATQGENEEVHLFLRKHFITNIPWIVLNAILLLLPPIIFFLFGNPIPPTLHLSPNTILIITLFYYIVVFGMLILANFINWYFNVYIVTNERIVDIDFVNILYREVSSTRLNLIQDVTMKTGGVVRAFFDYGDVFIQTAGTEVNFDFHAVPHPQEVAHEIEKLMRKARQKEGISELEEAMER